MEGERRFPIRVHLVSPRPGAAGSGTFLPSSFHFPFLSYSLKGGGELKAPSGTAQNAPTRPPPSKTHKSAEAGLGPRGRGAGQSVPARGSLTWRGQGSLGSRAEPHRPRCDSAGTRLSLDRGDEEREPLPNSRGKKKCQCAPRRARPGPNLPVGRTESPVKDVHL